MPLNTLSLNRPVTSYSKVQSIISELIRNRRFQLRHESVVNSKYLDIGCGDAHHSNFINIDYFWKPGINVCWDIMKGLPVADASLKGVFTQHCLEHFSLPSVKFICQEMYRVLSPGGTVRVVVPDGGMYLRTYWERIHGSTDRKFPYEDRDEFEGIRTPLLSVNRIFYVDRDSAFGHRTMYDFMLLKAMLERAGFVDVEQCAFGKGRDAQLLVDCPKREVESLYVEASRPGLK